MRDPLDLGGKTRVREDGAIRVDAVDGEPEGDLLVAVRHVEEASCDNFSQKLHNMYWQDIFVLLLQQSLAKVSSLLIFRLLFS